MSTKKSAKMAARDTQRRVNVIAKKVDDLQELAVPSMFCYATPWTGGLFVFGDERMTRFIKERKDEFLEYLKQQPENRTDETNEFLLPRLPQPIVEMNVRTLQTILVGIGKDLHIDWAGEKPVWWPENVPMAHPRDTPKEFKGQWSRCLKRVLKAIYEYFAPSDVSQNLSVAQIERDPTLSPLSPDPSIQSSGGLSSTPKRPTQEREEIQRPPLSPIQPQKGRKRPRENYSYEEFTPLAVRRCRRNI